MGRRLVAALVAALCSISLVTAPESTSAAGAVAKATWATKIVPHGVDGLSDVVCPSPTHCYALGGSGSSGPSSVIGSVDGGNRWQSLMVTPEGTELLAIACPRPSRCVVVGEILAVGTSQGPVLVNPPSYSEHPVAFVTTDGGAYWSSETLPKVGGVDGVACASVNVCLVIGYAEGIDRTTSGGTTWVMEKSPPLSLIGSVTCPARSFCVLGGTGRSSDSSPGSAVVSVSHDAGATWSKVVVVSGAIEFKGGSVQASTLDALSCSDARHCVGLVESDAASSLGTGQPMVTSDGGRIWRRGSRRVGWADSCAQNFCVSVGGHAQLSVGDAFLSTDGGTNWKPSNLPTRLVPTAVSCTSSVHCVVVGGYLPISKSALILTYSSR
jgi:hypothetical protein